MGRKLFALAAALALALLCVCACSTPQSQPQQQSRSQPHSQQQPQSQSQSQSQSQPAPKSENGFPLSDMSGYTGLEGYKDDLQFYDLTVKDIEKLKSEGKSFAFVAAFAGCPWCNLCIATLNDAAIAEGVQVGYLNTRLNPEWKSNTDIDDYDTFVALFGDYLRDDEKGIRHLYTPHVFFIKDGAVVAEHSGAVDGADDPSQQLTTEQKQELTKLYRDGFASIK